MDVDFPSAGWKRRLQTRLAAWYARHARDLPWRRRPAPYRVWVSEIMLQQTQVSTVTAVFRAVPVGDSRMHAKRWPPPTKQQVLRLWEGLGYYRRARQLHAAAQANRSRVR